MGDKKDEHPIKYKPSLSQTQHSPKRRYKLYRLYKSYKRTSNPDFSYYEKLNT